MMFKQIEMIEIFGINMDFIRNYLFFMQKK